MALSSNTIIHFTSEIGFLNGILTDNFQIRYCHERIVTDFKTFELGVPMVSFCDIPFSQIIKHIDSYGPYGIGLKKTWAKSKGLNPVLYIEKNSDLQRSFFRGLSKFVSAKPTVEKISNFSKEKRELYDIFRYMKNYEADLERHGKDTIKDYRFSDEREWRYTIPTSEKHTLFSNFEKMQEKGNHTMIKDTKQSLNKEIENFKLTFEPEDINYIIINKEFERDSVIRHLENVKDKYAYIEVKRLTSRIISVEQIRSDF